MKGVHVEVNPKDLRDIEQMPQNLEVSFRDMIRAMAEYALEEVRAAAPVRTGKVRDSFAVKLGSGKTPTAAIASPWFVARLQEHGYREHFHYLPSGARVLIPGKPRNPDGYYARPAIERAINHLAESGLDEVVRRL